MAKPTNSRKNNCTSQSSNCVQYDGPSLDCIELCSGETLTDLIVKMAAKICTLEKDLIALTLVVNGIVAGGGTDTGGGTSGGDVSSGDSDSGAL